MDKAHLTAPQARAIAEALLAPDLARQQALAHRRQQQAAAGQTRRQRLRLLGRYAMAGIAVGVLAAWLLGQQMLPGLYLGALAGSLVGLLRWRLLPR